MANRTLKLISLDIIASILALYLAFLLRFEFDIPREFLQVYFNWAPWFVLVQISIFYLTNLYARIWRYTSLFDLYAILG